ncbi:MAG: hypothetical protein ACI83I_000847 [Bacteroidia bacterium]|jgi:hypothetical protein
MAAYTGRQNKCELESNWAKEIYNALAMNNIWLKSLCTLNTKAKYVWNI